MARPEKYIGIHKELNGGMTTIGKMIHDAWVFKIIEETETCENWNYNAINALLHKVNAEWDKYGCLVSNLPPDLFEKHQRIHNEALKKAKAAGWSGNIETDGES